MTLDVAAEVTASGTLLVTVATNLPDGSELGGWLSSGDYQAQDRRYVDDGVVVLGPFSDDGGRLQPGTYDFSVSMSIARLQSAEVRRYVGEKRELMTVRTSCRTRLWAASGSTSIQPSRSPKPGLQAPPGRILRVFGQSRPRSVGVRP